MGNMHGMGWGMGFLSLLVVLFLVLGIIAFAKYILKG